MTENRAIFLDRDGTLNVDTGYVKDPDDLALLPTVVEALEAWHEAHFKLFIVTNQSGIARGYFTHEMLHKIHQKLRALLRVPIQEISYCPHLPSAHCKCRKPEPGMILDLAAKHNVHLASSFMIGDKLSDWEAGQRAGVKSFQMRLQDSLFDFVAKTIDFSKTAHDFSRSSVIASDA